MPPCDKGRAPARSRRQASDGRVPCSALDGRCAPARPALHVSTRFRTCGAGRDALPRGAAVRRPTAVSRAAPWMADALRRVRRCTSRRVSARVAPVGTRSRAEPPSGVRRPCPVQRFGWSMRSGASGVARLDPPFVVLYSALSIIAPSVNVLRRTRRKPSTIRGAAPDVVIGQSTADRAGARPYQPGVGSSTLLRARSELFEFNQKNRRRAD